ncbi:DUF2142 domain-containing protein [Lactococcus piscium]|uniref:DUF2142 domain-containing protein n=1 Tax=Pseudolactococcus paracarnosus TaxID=2749962 RepID=A0A7L4WH97_9LACT|nr:DUF2142 domain-containing protein [Lactococcus paracarnosus]SPC36889.1 putative Membrane protein [Lactococcus piscium]MCJ1976862.1 DUF2142 domain-containing protein [Lactococcus paracarnosus]MCJ1982752.1 DUF2142 domain-containing protein [Lactococcus paracarnosus]MCJ1994862.1 DUF2142 domain-containing protein [Lactococcus paracarnosus]QDJ28873.1 hypothetical protein BHS01_10185 [Lactococcus paracarnosus]
MIQNTLNEGINNIKKNKIIFIIMFFLLFLSHFMFPNKVAWPQKYMLLAFFVLITLMLLLNFNDVKKISRNAFWIILLIGIMNSLILPAGTGLDEQPHYAVAAQIADGRFINLANKQEFYDISPDAAFNPEGQLNKYNLYSKEWLALRHVQSDYSKIKIRNYNIANPVFIPSAIGIKLGRLLSPYVYVSYYLGRMFNILALAIMAYFAIKKSKHYKIVLFGMSTIPICLWIPAGYNYDAFYYGLSLLAIAWLVNMFDVKKKIQTKDIVMYTIFCSLIVLAKAPVVSIIILPLFIPKSYYQSANTKIIALIPIIVGIICSGVWLVQSRIFALLGMVTITESSKVAGKVPNLTYFVTHIRESIEVFTRTFIDTIGQSLFEQIAIPNGHLQAPFLKVSHPVMNNANIVIFVLMLVITSFSIDIKIPKYFKAILLMLDLFMIFAIIYAISGDPRVYTQGYQQILGVQGRYLFIVIVSLPLLLSESVRKILNNDVIPVDMVLKQREYIYSIVMKLCFCGALLTSYVYFYSIGALNF